MIRTMIATMLCGCLVYAFAAGFAAAAEPTDKMEKLALSARELKPGQDDRFIAELTDEQARKVLRTHLKAEADERARAQSDKAEAKNQLAARVREARNNLAATPANLLAFPAAVERAGERLAAAERGGGLLRRIVGALSCVLIGGAAAFAYGRMTESADRKITDAAERNPPGGQLFLIILRMGLELGLPLVFYAAAHAVFHVWDPESQAAETVFDAAAWGVFVFLALRAFARLILSPQSSNLRLITMDDEAAAALLRGAINLSFALAALTAFGHWLRDWEIGDGAMRAAMLFAGTIGVIAIVSIIWRARLALRARPAIAGAVSLPGAARVLWPWLASAYVAIIFIIVNFYLHAGVALRSGAAIISFAVLPVALLIDHIGQRLLQALARRQIGRLGLAGDVSTAVPEASTMPPSTTAPAPADVLSGWTVIANLFRLFVVVAALLVFFWAWGLDLAALFEDSVGPRLARAVLTIVIYGSVAYLVYGIVRAWFNRRMAVDAMAAMAPGAAVAGKSRFESLLPVIRAVALTAIVIASALMILSNLGVEIGPLIAGAGILGLAVGFGAQTLVRNIIQGVFFLTDDAFRVGEYIEVDKIKGTVEKISLTSMRLRHQRGALHTLPYGGIRSITNLSRDWVVHKLEFRLPYGTDIDKVRKLVKKVGEEMLDNPEWKDSIIAPLKSQGVNRMDESALIFTAKFMSKPDDKQFDVRRQAYRRIQAALYENGIEFAPHRVIVDVAPSAARDEKASAGAAIVAAALAKTKPAEA